MGIILSGVRTLEVFILLAPLSLLASACARSTAAVKMDNTFFLAPMTFSINQHTRTMSNSSDHPRVKIKFSPICASQNQRAGKLVAVKVLH
ncbi:hypothetical protein C8R48DRAFT_700495 [Suillus tomentosus]|nr:hypothetical protein C8R48DRAFT_700495 [Suillus tomentosus]